ncbi:hypothetical protein KP509_30G052300 [Ceratopteris richardii]|uniref:Ycf54 n=1 Tax=Ceratopteris richardii TaxID=49495 RepID=A0A8T2R409_CERRI|nr:hypothetical protein KP509_30G052300 [Ceratopteris richardii]
MALATTSTGAVSSAASQVGPNHTQFQAQDGINLRSSHQIAIRSFSRCKALTASSYKPSCHQRMSSLIPVRAVSTTTEESVQDVSTDKPRKYHFVVANAKFMLDEEEHFQELMRERLRLFAERNREQDFWLVIEPQFLDKFPDITKRLRRPAVALVSTDELWITFMKLRLDRVLKGEFEAGTLTEALKSNPAEVNFEKPQVWTAPYPKYESPWWTPFLPPSEQ